MDELMEKQMEEQMARESGMEKQIARRKFEEEMEKLQAKEMEDKIREMEDQIRESEYTVKQLLAGTVFVLRRLWVYSNNSVKLTMLFVWPGTALV